MTHTVKAKMNGGLLSRNFTRFSPFAAFIALAACSSVLGIKDLHEGPAPGSAGSAGTGTGGSNGSGGNPGNGGASTMTGGSAGKGQGGGSAGNGGSTVTGGSTGMGEAGIGAGGESPGDTTVHGTVIDYWGHPVPQIPIQIGDTLVTTDAQGKFTVDNVPAKYDVGLTVDFSGDFPRETYGWSFQGLTRRDPTLQVYAGIARQSGNIIITPTNAAVTSTRALTVSLGGPDGAEEFSGLDGAIQTSTAWRGPATTQERAHGLFWQIDATSELPTNYLGYDTALVALSNTTDVAMINLNLNASGIITSGNIAGAITPASGASRENDVFLRFTSGASIQLASDTPGPNTFSYLVPSIPNSGITLAAVEGDAFRGQYAVVHKDGLAPNTTGITATIPTPAKPLAPADGATNIDSTSQFTILAGAGNAGAYLVSMIDDNFYQGLYVVTASKTFNVPVVPGGPYMFASTHTYSWRVETHGSLATVDAMAGPTGFMDEFSGDDLTPIGPHATSGSFTISQSNGFTAK